jgi:cellulose synthase/poly-beta-1,6-N-acetylglucosamine synthase-like glycosyltransferase
MITSVRRYSTYGYTKYCMDALTLKNFFIPKTFASATDVPEGVRVCAIVPTYKPSPVWTVKLVQDLLKYNSDITVFVVNDCTPQVYEDGHHVFKTLRSLPGKVYVLSTPQNKLKAGAINYCLQNIYAGLYEEYDVVMTLDDDVVIEKNTVRELVKGLLADEKIGAVCSQARVLNKNTNLLTRLQGLEYLGFNAMRLGDEGFIHGPLVMHGMLTAFRFDIFNDGHFFAEGHLIEDYEITTRIKEKNLHVRLVPSAYAWTEVPETLLKLWDQRVRWVYGGLKLMFTTRPKAIFQDVIGHSVFLSTLILVFLFFFIQTISDPVSRTIVYLILGFSIAQMLVWYVFQLWFMRFYAEKDWKDWVIRASLIPEFLYANMLSAVLIGAYLFDFFTFFVERTFMRVPILRSVARGVKTLFGNLGYSKYWGTR